MWADTANQITVNDSLTITGDLVNGTTNIFTALNSKVNTGDHTKAFIGLGNVDNTNDLLSR